MLTLQRGMEMLLSLKGKGDGVATSPLLSKGEGMSTYPTSLKVDEIHISPFSLERNGDGMRAFPFHLRRWG